MMMTYPSDTFAFKKAEILKIMQSIDPSFDLGFVPNTNKNDLIKPIEYENEIIFDDYRKLLFKMPLLSLWEAASIICGIDPALLDELNEYDARAAYPELSTALNLLNSSYEAGLIEFHNSKISKQELQVFLSSQEISIAGFNQISKKTNNLMNISDIEKKYNDLLSQNKILIDNLEQAKERIKQLETEQKSKLSEIQTSEQDSKLSTREENNIIRVLAVLAELERKIDISKPYEAHGIMAKKAELLGVDPFPSNESIKKWFLKATEYKNPN